MTANPRAWGHGPRFAIPRRWRAGGALLALAMTVGACASPVLAPNASNGPKPEPSAKDPLHRQAHDALVRWAAAVRESGGALITFTGDLASVVGSFETDGQKASFAAGAIQAVTDLSDDRPARGQVKWVDGKSIDVNVLSAAATFEALVAGATDCPDCVPLRVTDANLATALVETSDGPAEVPVWVFTIAGSSVRVSRVAVDKGVTVTPPPWNADDPPAGISIDTATGGPNSKRLTVSFAGATMDGSKPCGADYTAEAVESELAVVVIVEEHRNPAKQACDLVARQRTAEVTLASKLGERAVLEVRQGLPVPVVAP